MKKDRFIEERKASWKRFEELLRRVEKSRLSRLSGKEVSEFSRLFRALCYDLAMVRSRDWGREIENYLNDLVLRGHGRFYRAPPGRPREALRFFTHGFPTLLRANIAYFWVALALFLVPGIISGIVVYRDPSLAGRILPGVIQDFMDTMYSESREGGSGMGGEAGAAGFYLYNNVGIAFRCFATGILFGVGTVYYLIYNSIFIGSITGFLLARGHSDRFLSFTISHGSFELTAIVIAGMAGLILGHAIVHPGRWSRAESLRRRGLVAIRLAAGAAAMLGVAALIEGFWSPSDAPNAAKYAVGCLLWIAVISYLVLAGREKRAT